MTKPESADDLALELAELRRRVRELEEQNLDLKSELDHMESQHEVLENFVFGLEREHERARMDAESARASMAALKAEADDILEHMQQGILTLGPDLRINAGYSRAACDLFGQSSLAGLTLSGLLGERAPPELPRYLRLLFDSTTASTRLIERLNPLRSHRYYDATGRERVVSFSFSRITHRAGVVKKVIVVMDDSSELERLNQVLEQKNREQWERLERAYRILSLPADAFRDFVREAREVTRLFERALNEPDAANWDLTLRTLHSLKGNARVLGLDDLAEHAHGLEESAIRLGKKRGEARLALARDRLLAFAGALEDGNQLFSHLMGLRDSLEAHRENPREELARALEKLAEREAFAAQKRVHLSLLEKGAEALDAPTLYRLRSALVQLVRNAVHHGIEPSAERVHNGKAEHGEIRVELKAQNGELSVSCIDDGRGIDAERVKERALAQGLLTRSEAERLERPELHRLILRAGLSTEQEAHLGAGRGLGMTVVTDALEMLRGRLEIHSEPGLGTEFRLIVPSVVTKERKADQGGYDEHLGSR
jgi:signal transduction histidine kinase